MGKNPDEIDIIRTISTIYKAPINSLSDNPHIEN
jgi:hypothetical protein